MNALIPPTSEVSCQLRKASLSVSSDFFFLAASPSLLELLSALFEATFSAAALESVCLASLTSFSSIEAVVDGKAVEAFLFQHEGCTDLGELNERVDAVIILLAWREIVICLSVTDSAYVERKEGNRGNGNGQASSSVQSVVGFTSTTLSVKYFNQCMHMQYR